MNTILANNSFNIVETRDPLAAGGIRRRRPSANER